MTDLSQVLREVMLRAGVGAQTLSKLTGVPRTAIDNWRDGTVRRPRHWRPLLQIARVLSLTHEEADRLLIAAGHVDLSVLIGDVSPTDPDRACLTPWLGGRTAPVVNLRRQLRAPAADFVGRGDALAAVTAALRRTRGQQSAAVVGVRGMGGVGKTELALLAANRTRTDFPDAQVHIHLHGLSPSPLSTAQALGRVIHAISPDARLDDDVEALQRRYCSVLAGRRVLVLADDASDAAQVRPLLPPPGNALLVTSRQRFALPGMAAVDLDQLPEADAVRMLRSICHRITTVEAAAIARACGCLPLALRISGSLLANDPALPVADHVALLVDRRRLAQLRDPDDGQLDIAASLGLSYERLDETSQAVFRRLGVMAADFTTDLAVACVDPDADVGAVSDVESTLRRLLRHNLLAFDPERRRWHLHDLVRDLARARLDAAGEYAQTMWRHARSTLDLAASIHERLLGRPEDSAEAFAAFDAERPHVDAARQWAADHAGTPDGDRLLIADAVATYNQIGFMRYDRTILPVAHLALGAARRQHDLAAEAIVLNRLGQLHLDLGDASDALDHFGRQLSLMADAGDPLGQARAANNLGIARLRLGDPHGARELHELQLRLVREIGERLGEAMALCNLGQVAVSLGQIKRALTELEPGLKIIRELRHPYGEGMILHAIGRAYLSAGDAVRAQPLLESAHDVARDLGDRDSQARVLADLARATIAIGDVEAGLADARRALHIAESSGTYQTEAEALRALAAGHDAKGEHCKARVALERALAVLCRIGARGHAAECGWQLGCSLLAVDRTRALSLLRDALAYEQEVGHATANDHADLLYSADGAAIPPSVKVE